MSERLTIRCRDCGLNQFQASKCRRCSRDLTQKETIAELAEIPLPKSSEQFVPCRTELDHEKHVLNARFIGRRVKQLRIGRGFYQSDLAQAMGCARTYISKIERGTTQPVLTQLLRLAKALDVHPAVILASDRELAVRDLLADPFIAGIAGIGSVKLNSWQRNEIVEYAKKLAGGQ
jgi:transcriptional regulator with XRE-family HTH domain